MTHEVKLGELIKNPLQQRDAVHVAVAPVMAATRLWPNSPVGMLPGQWEKVAPPGFMGVKESIGRVDPFLTESIGAGSRFWLFLYPGTIVSLRHDWEHPAFPVADVRAPDAAPAPSKLHSEQWMLEFASETNLGYHEVIAEATGYLRSGMVYVEQGSESLRDAIYNCGTELFWHHFEIITGIVVDENVRGDNPFSCSC